MSYNTSVVSFRMTMLLKRLGFTISDWDYIYFTSRMMSIRFWDEDKWQ
jgi:hypothetical protein